MIKYILLIFCFSTISIAQQDDRGYIIKTGQLAPDFNLKQSDGTVFSLSDHIGKVIMLQFTASWCSVCLKEMPYIENEIWQIYKSNEDFVLIALAKDTKKRQQGDNEISFMREKTQVTYAMERDINSQIFQLFAKEKAGVTRNIIINQKGEIEFLTRLFDKKEFDEMKSIIKYLLN